MRPRPHGLLLKVCACGLALTIVIAVAVGFVVRYLYQQEMADTRRSLVSLSTVLADQADRALQAIELIQQRVLDEMTAAGIVDEPGFLAAMSTRAVHDTLTLRIAALPQVNAITLDDREGNLVNFSRYWPVPRVNIADRDYFQAISADPDMQRFISRPVPNRGDGKWTLYIARRVNGPNREFLGLVLGAVELDYFQKLYDQIAPAPDYVLSLSRTDGTLLIRHPASPDSVGKLFPAAGPQLATGIDAGGGVIRIVSPIDSQDRLVSSAALAHFPIRLIVSRTVDATLARWRGQTAVFIGIGLLLEAGMLALLWLGTRAVLARRRLAQSERARHLAETRASSERAVREHLARVGTALDNMAQGLCMLAPDGRLLVANEQLRHILGWPHLPAVGSTVAAVLRLVLPARLLPARDTRRVVATLRRAHRTRRPVQLTETLHNGRSVLLHLQPVDTGGALLTCSDVTEQRRAETTIAFLAHFDPLTELPNRSSLLSSLEQKIQRARPGAICAVLCINLQRFREVNDAFGHAVGDLLLREVAARLRAVAGPRGLVARLGGDEFALAFCGLDRPEQHDAVADRLTESLGRPCELGGRVVSVGLRVGVALGTGDATPADTLLRNAQLAMHCSKMQDAAKPVVFNDAMIGASQAARQLEADLLAALHGNELQLHYQPLVHLRTREVVGFEALLRWRHRVRGPVSPGEFIPLAERTGLIVPIGEWVLRTACAEAASWPSDQKIAVNLSAVQIRDRRLVPIVRGILDQTGLPPGRLELEITESVLLRDTAETLEVLHELHHLGISVALDDFGTGYSSLSYLRSFPFDKVKIDRSFVGDLGTNGDARAIVRAILGLCAELGINTLAEGIEQEEQADTLVVEDCRDGQGYLFGRPVSPAQLAPYLRQRPILTPPTLASALPP